MLRCFQLEAILGAVIPLKSCLRMIIAKLLHTAPADEKAVVFVSQFVDHFIKFRLEFVRFILCQVIFSCGVKLIATAEISTQMTDTASLPLKLHALIIRIHPFLRPHTANIEYHIPHLSNSFLAHTARKLP